MWVCGIGLSTRGLSTKGWARKRPGHCVVSQAQTSFNSGTPARWTTCPPARPALNCPHSHHPPERQPARLPEAHGQAVEGHLSQHHSCIHPVHLRLWQRDPEASGAQSWEGHRLHLQRGGCCILPSTAHWLFEVKLRKQAQIHVTLQGGARIASAA